jgi:beta-glucosidase
MRNALIVIVLGFSFFGYSQKKGTKKSVTIKPKTEFVAELMAKMTLDEKIGQLNLPTSGDITTGAANSSDVAKNIEEGKVGGLFNIKSVEEIKEVHRIAVEKSCLKIPLLFGMDVIHGYETTFPTSVGQIPIY